MPLVATGMWAYTAELVRRDVWPILQILVTTCMLASTAETANKERVAHNAVSGNNGHVGLYRGNL
jgi:hypothetical protein